MEQRTQRLVLFVVVAVLCYAGLVFVAQGGDYRSALQSFPLSYIPLLLVLASLNYLLRFVRWQMYLRALGAEVPPWRSFCVFMAGLAMTVTPGKAGEALKAHLLRGDVARNWSVGLPAVFAERLSDLMGVVILVLVGMVVFPVGRDAALAGAVLCAVLVVVASRPGLSRKALGLLGRVPGMAERSAQLLDMHHNVQRVLSPGLLAVTLCLSVAAWFAECLVLHFALMACTVQVGLLESTFVYALSTLAGALSILPGGLVVTEGSMAGLLHLSGVELALGTAVTIVVRFCTLWFAVLVGMAFLPFARGRDPEGDAPLSGPVSEPGAPEDTQT